MIAIERLAVLSFFLACTSGCIGVGVSYVGTERYARDVKTEYPFPRRESLPTPDSVLKVAGAPSQKITMPRGERWRYANGIVLIGPTLMVAVYFGVPLPLYIPAGGGYTDIVFENGRLARIEGDHLVIRRSYCYLVNIWDQEADLFGCGIATPNVLESRTEEIARRLVQF